MNKEIEKKFTIKYLPKDIKIEKIEKIEQAFIYLDKNTLIRIRKLEINKQKQYIYTVKTKGDIEEDTSKLSKIYEIESNISKEFYEELMQKKVGNIISKTRVVVPINNENIENNLKVEIDIYCDYLEDFLTAEVEFQNEEEAKKFEKPDWLGEELSYKELSNRNLSKMNKEEFNNKVSKEFLEHNKSIIEELNKLIK